MEAEDRIGRALDRGAHAEAATLALTAYGPQIRGYLAVLLGNEALAGDAFSHFCEDLWKGIKGFRRESAFRTWAYRLAYNAAGMVRREAFRRRVRPIYTNEYSELAARLVRTTLVGLDPLADRRLDRIRATMTPAERTLLILRIDKGLGWNDIATVLSEDEPVDAATLRKRFERLKKRLLEQARAEGLDAGAER
jgi:RNA polymerase sigma-70 factor (ECF subfamily)